MEKRKKDMEKVAVRIFCVLCGGVMLVLFMNALRASWVNREFWNEFVYRKEDSVVWNLLGILAGLFMLAGIGRLSEKFLDRRRRDVLAAFIGVVCVCIGIYWVTVSRTEPQGDQENIVDYAVDYKNGDISSLQKGAYVANHQQQLGLITFMRVLFLVFGQGNYRAYQYLCACMIWLLVFAGYRITGYLTDRNPKAEIIWLVCVLLCVPMYGYAPFVYGELSSTVLVFAAGWLLLSVFRKYRVWKLPVLAGLCGAMVQLRQNTLVCVIGFLVVLVVRMFAKADRRIVYTGAAILTGVAVFQAGISMMYKPYLPRDAKTVPALLFIVMGMNDDIEGEPGWYNDYNEITYRENGYDPQKAVEAATEDLRLFADKCLADPGWALRFFGLKTNIQWNVPMYQCLVMNNAFYDDPGKLAEDIYFNGKDRYLESFMEIYQLLIYGGALAFLIFVGFGNRAVERCVLMICVFGGFLFSLMWEAKPRYVFPYFMLMIPCAAVGITIFLQKTDEWMKKIRKRL